VACGTNTAAYGHLANSPLVGHIWLTMGSTLRMTTTKQPDFLSRLTAIASVGAGSTSPPVSSSYAYNLANQRTALTNADNSRWDCGYDSLGRVTSGGAGLGGGEGGSHRAGGTGGRGWTEETQAARRKEDEEKMELAVRLRRETTIKVLWIAERLHLGTPTHQAHLLICSNREGKQQVILDGPLYGIPLPRNKAFLDQLTAPFASEPARQLRAIHKGMKDGGISGILQSRIPVPPNNAMTQQAIVNELKDIYQTTSGFENAWPAPRAYLLRMQQQGHIPSDVLIPSL
jgi:YD repeat-containing protein